MRYIRFVLTILVTVFCLSVYGQTQQGFVKTKGRMVNGKHVHGKGLPGSTVKIQGGNSIGVRKTNGSFSFVVSAKNFMVESVQKKGYELVDADATTKSYQQSPNPLYLVMETPEQQLEDLLEAEEKISKTLREQLKLSRQEIQRLKDKNIITEEEYRQRIAKLMEEQKNNKDLIADMAKEYAQIDYDQMNDINRRISAAILNGHLLEADSLLRSKGDINSRIAQNRKKQQAEIQEEEELELRHNKLEISKVGTQKEKEDIASDCYNFFNRFKLSNQYDSAAYYIVLRAELDLQKPKWQIEAAHFFYEQHQYKKAEKYLKMAMEVSNQLAKSDPHTYKMFITWAQCLLGGVYFSLGKQQEALNMFKDFLTNVNTLAGRYTGFHSKQMEWLYLFFSCLITPDMENEEKEKMLTKALGVCDSMDNANSLNIAMAAGATYFQLASLYSDMQHYKEAEAMYKGALISYRKATEKNKECESNISNILRSFANFYSQNLHFSESEAMYLDAVEMDRRLVKINPQKYEENLAKDLDGLACVYVLIQKTQECETFFQEAIMIYRHLVDQDSSLYEPKLANTLNHLAGLYCILHRYTESEVVFNESLKICRSLAINNPQKYEANLATTLYGFANMYKDKGLFQESESLYKEALDIHRRLSAENPQEYEYAVAGTLYNLGILKLLMERPEEAFPTFEETVDILRRIGITNPEQRQLYANSLNILSTLYTSKNKEKAYSLYEECIPIMKNLYSINPEQWKSGYSQVLGNQSYICLFVKQFLKSESYAREGLTVDSTQHFIYSNLASALLFQGKYKDAEKIYQQYEDELKDAFLDDFKQFAEAGVIPKKIEKDVEKIKQLLNK